MVHCKANHYRAHNSTGSEPLLIHQSYSLPKVALRPEALCLLLEKLDASDFLEDSCKSISRFRFQSPLLANYLQLQATVSAQRLDFRQDKVDTHLVQEYRG